jgi:tetratricopeptide (TPR) repeat protein
LFASGRSTDLPKGDAESPPLVATYGDNDVYWVDTGFIAELRSEIVNKQCAAEVVREVYERDGIQPAADRLAVLYSTERDRHYFPLYDLLALCEDMIKDGRKSDADLFYGVLVEALPYGHRIELGYGMICTMNGFVREGLALLERALSDNPDELRWEVQFRGNDLLRTSDLDAAEDLMRFNLEKFPEWPLSYTGLAAVHERRGEIDEAVDLCREALEIRPNDRDVLAMLERLEGM